MTERFQDKYRIPSARLQNWDYGWNGIYYITICTEGREHYFGKINDKVIELSEIGLLAHQFWCEIPSHFPFVDLDAYVVMPNHIHGILIIDKYDDRSEMKTGSENELRPAFVETRHCLVSTPYNIPTPNNIQHSKGNHNDNNNKENIPELNDEEDFDFISNDIAPGQKRFRNQGKNNISSIIGSYKSVVSKQAHQIKSGFGWQARFYDHIVQSDREFDLIRKYIGENPANWGMDKYFGEDTA